MTTSKDGPGPPHDSADTEGAELHEPLGVYLEGLLTRAFEVPQRDAERIVREMFADYKLNKPASDARAWLIGAVCREANDYRRRRGLPAADERAAERHAATVLSYRDAMDRLPSRAREALRLRFEEKKTYAEVAEQLGLSVYAAERFVSKALFRLRELLRGEQTRQP
jgi:DNA-directed RNA polymerase specialized sigma24 family protein